MGSLACIYANLRNMVKILLLLCYCIHQSQSATDSDVKNLLTELFTTRAYNKLVRPIVNQSDPIEVFVEYSLFSLSDVNEVEQKITTTGYLEIDWIDEFLKWDPVDYGGLEYIHLPQDQIWKPDISLQNGFKELKELGSSFIQIFIQYDGSILWTPFQIFESRCGLDPTYFPFDKQKCDLVFVVWSLDKDDVILYVGSDGIEMTDAKNSNGQWDVVSSMASDEKEGIESTVSFTLEIKRKPLFVVMNVLIPIVLLSVLNIYTFQIPADCGERMGYTITVWLSFAVFLTIVSASLPKTSDITPVVSIFIMMQLAIGTLTVLISSLESRLVTKDESTTVYAVFRKLALLKIGRARVSAVTNSEKSGNGSDLCDVTWKQGIMAFDGFFFWFFLILLAVTTFIMIMVTALS